MSEIKHPVTASPTDLGPYICANCGYQAGEKFCASCGQARMQEMPSASEFVQEYAAQFVAVDGRLWKTIKVLFSQPGQLVLDYCNGIRARYLRPLNLYLSASFLFFSVLLTLTPVLKDDLRDFELGFKRGLAGASQRSAAPLSQTTVGAIDEATPLLSIGSSVAFFSLPCLAMWLTFGLRRQRRHFAVHLLTAMHFQSFALLLFIAMLPLYLINTLWVELARFVIGLTITFFYFVLSLRRVYQVTWLRCLSSSVIILSSHAIFIMLLISLWYLWELR